ncbi:uncharacterized protein [Eurosta solidaginis]|uniref:uncharacterized protein isoform X2 n=1 Tax=Eurosta solidaginis TaxID=178769 RepID=UPI003530C58C
MMTKFMSFFNLSRINDSKELLGVSPDCIKGNLVVTLSRNIITVVKLQKSVLDIATYEDYGIILYIDGSFDQLSDVISTQNRSSTTTNFWSNSHLRHDNVKNIEIKCLNSVQILTYFEVDEYSKEVDLVMKALNFSASQRRFKIRRKDMAVNLSGYAIVEGDTRFMLLTIWSDHRLFLFSLDEDVESENLPGNFISLISALKVDSPITIAGVAKNCVAIYGANSSQEGASLLLYNTQFKVVKAQQYFKVYFDSCRIWINDDNILIAMGQNLSVVSFRMSHDLLVDLLGTYNTEQGVAIEGDLINEECQLQSFCSLKENELRKSNVSPESNQHYSVCLKSEEKGRKVTYSDELNQTLVSVGQERSLIDDIVHIVEKPSENNLLYETLLEFYIHQLDNCGATEQEILEKLLAMRNKMKNCSIIMNVVSQFSCASEFVIAKAFSFIIENYTLPKDSNVVFSSLGILEPFILKTVSQPLKKIAFIQNYRNDASSFRLLFLLDSFYVLLTEPFCFEPFCVENVKLEMQILCWFDFLLSAHFQHLVLSREVEVLNLLYKWIKLIIAYKNQMKKLQEVLRLLYNVIQNERISEKSNTYMWYCIEDICF